jgi:uncharacterized protein
MGQASHEPSMEDILASIKRIIAEDSEAVGARPARLRREAISAVQSSPAVLRAADMPVVPVEPPPAPEIELDDLPEDRPEEADAAQDWAPEDELADARSVDDEGGEHDEPVASADKPDLALPEQAPEDVLELTSPMPEANSEMPDTHEAPSAKPAIGLAAGIDGLVSGQAATASRNAFAALTQLQVRNEEGQSNTLEGLVADLLRPMLREWLDRELPTLVERVVTAEVRRLSGGAN